MNQVTPYLGAVVSTPIAPFLAHVGIISDISWPGVPRIISSSRRRGMVAEESLAEFSGGRTVRIIGYPSQLPAELVIMRARSKLGEKWNLWEANCEHFVNWTHGLEPASKQLQIATAVLAGIGISLAAMR